MKELCSEDKSFEWAKQWYPVAVINFLDRSCPQTVTLLGKNLILWQEFSGKWRCFKDPCFELSCPYRLAIISKKKVQDDECPCACYLRHFNSRGKCLNLTLFKESLLETEENYLNEDLLEVIYPTQEKQGLLWVYPESGIKGLVESRLKKPKIISQLAEKSERTIQTSWYLNDLPISWDIFIENILDPTLKLNFYNSLPKNSSKNNNSGYDLINSRKISSEGFSYKITSKNVGIKEIIYDFQAPYLITLNNLYINGDEFIIVLYVSPTQPGWCRYIGCQILIKNEDSNNDLMELEFFSLFFPTWLDHFLKSNSLNQDLSILYQLDKNRNREKWPDNIYISNPSDEIVVRFHNWLKRSAGSYISWTATDNSKLLSSYSDKNKLSNSWSNHAQTCSVCRTTLKKINLLANFSFVASFSCLFSGILLDCHMIVGLAMNEGGNMSLLTITPNIYFWYLYITSFLLFSIGYIIKRKILI